MRQIKVTIASLLMLIAFNGLSSTSKNTGNKTENSSKKKSTSQLCEFTFDEITYVMDIIEGHDYYPIVIPEYNAEDVWTWYRVSKRYDVDMCTLLLLNEVAKPNQLKAGQIVFIPNQNQ